MKEEKKEKKDEKKKDAERQTRSTGGCLECPWNGDRCRGMCPK